MINISLYFDYLKTLLSPLRLYELDAGYGARELELAGARLDEVYSTLEESERESIVMTAGDFGLDAYEELLPYRPVTSTTQARRDALAALMRIDGRSFTVDALNDTIGGCGVRANVREGAARQTVELRFPGVSGIPEDFERLSVRIEKILPCHLGVGYVFAFISWDELEEKLPTWDTLEAAGFSWTQLEMYTDPMGDD